MKSSKVQTLCVCGCCKRSLPASAFYINKKTGLPGNLVFLGGGVRTRADVEAEVIGGSGRIVILVLHVDGHAFGVEHFDIQGQGLH